MVIIFSVEVANQLKLLGCDGVLVLAHTKFAPVFVVIMIKIFHLLIFKLFNDSRLLLHLHFVPRHLWYVSTKNLIPVNLVV